MRQLLTGGCGTLMTKMLSCLLRKCAIFLTSPSDFAPLPQEKDRAFIIFREVIDISFAQANLLQRGILIRGGMTVGPLFYDSSHVFGPGLVRAYELESRLAIYPRIVTEMYFDRYFPEYTKGEFPFVETDFDGIPYLSYLSPNTFASAVGMTLNALKQAHTSITLNLQDTRSEVGADRQKQLWLVRKFNELANQLNKPGFLIDPTQHFAPPKEAKE